MVKTNPITIRIYDCSEQDLKTIENNYNVTNIKTFLRCVAYELNICKININCK